jgi:hypothetical protein
MHRGALSEESFLGATVAALGDRVRWTRGTIEPAAVAPFSMRRYTAMGSTMSL